MRQFFDNLAKKIAGYYEGLKPDSEEGRLVLEMKDQIGELRQLFAEALAEASENYQSSEGIKNTTPEGGRKYSISHRGRYLDLKGIYTDVEKRRYWYPNMTKSEISDVKSLADHEAKTTNNYLGINAKWLYNNQKGHSYFALYSTADAEGTTLLYACKDERAKFEYEWLLEELEEGGYADGYSYQGTEASVGILGRIRDATSGQTLRVTRPAGTGSNDGNVAVHSRNRRNRPGKAFENCIRNCAEVQSRYGVDDHYLFAVERGDMEAAQRMVEQAAKAAGYTRLFYHGAKKGGGFTRFREWSYFTENKKYAERYAQRDNPGSLYTVYGKLENPFDTRDSEARAIFEDIRNEYGLSEIQDTGLPDWTDGYDITDYIDENGLDYDSVVLDEGGDLVDGKPVSRGLSYVIRNSEQVKSADVITYDDDGNIIPISKRFDSSNPDIRYSLRKKAPNLAEENERLSLRLTQADIQSIQSIGRKSVNQFTTADIQATERFAQQYWKEMGTKSPFFRAWFGDWRVNDKTPVQIADQRGDTRGVQHNEDTGWDINVSGKVFNESKHNAKKNQNALPYLHYINDIVKKAVLLDSYGLDAGKTKSSNSLLMHSLYVVADVGMGPELLKLYVEEMNDPNTAVTGKRAYQLQNIEKQQLSVQGSGVNPSPITSTATIQSVADLVSVVKQHDPDFQPNPASTVTNPDGTPMAVYHGTNRDFTVFQSKDGCYWFSESEDYAESMAEERGSKTVMQAYLNMRRPYRAKLPPGQFSDPGYEAPIIRAAKAGNYDGVIIEVDTQNELEMDTFYVVFDNTQIKSATNNVGTFDGSNPDIRYSTRRKIGEQKQSDSLTTAQESDGRQFSDWKQAEKKALLEDKYYARQIDKWDGKDHGGSFRVGKVSDPLLKIGIPDVDIWFDQSKAAKQLEGKDEVTKDVLKRIPYLLEHPIAISESYDNTVMVFGEMYDENGNPIVVALRVNSTNRRNHITLVNKIRSVGTRTHNLDKLLSDDAILYLHETKKETNRWFNALGRSTPFGGTKFGLIRSISFDVEKSNIIGTESRNNSAVLNQDRATGTSNRALLADTLEGVAKSPTEKKYLREYRESFEALEAQEAKLRELNKQIREISFGKGPRDMGKLKQLREEAARMDDVILLVKPVGIKMFAKPL